MSNLPAVMRDIQVGTVLTYSRAYSADDLKIFNELSEGLSGESIEFVPDLLALAPLTKIGGDLNYIAQRMAWTAHRRVVVGERLEAQLIVQRLEERESVIKISFAARIIGEADDIVLHGESNGIVAKV